MNEETSQQEQQTPNLFAITNEHFKLLLCYDYELLEETTPVETMSTYLKSNAMINSFYMIQSKKLLLVYLKDSNEREQVEAYLNEASFWKLCKRELPNSSFSSSLVSEVTDAQLKRLSDDKSKSLKLIESQTGELMQ